MYSNKAKEASQSPAKAESPDLQTLSLSELAEVVGGPIPYTTPPTGGAPSVPAGSVLVGTVNIFGTTYGEYEQVNPATGQYSGLVYGPAPNGGNSIP